MTFAPTTEQTKALDLFKTGRSLAIEAGAGTGKTSTLTLLAEAAPHLTMQFIAFNKSIVKDAGTKFPRNVNCSTAHSLAWRTVGAPFDERMRLGKRMRSIDIANRLGINPVKVETFDGETKLLSSTFLAGLAIRAVTRFCQTADLEPSSKHVPHVPSLDGIDKRHGPANEAVAKHLAPAVKKAWADLTNLEGGLPFTKSIAMNVFLKLWHLSNPVIGADVILFDEAQDANPVMQAVVALQADPEFRAGHGMKPAQLVYVGDSQQQIYGFTGAVNALKTIGADNRAFLTQSFRFGDAIADVANHVLGLIPDAELRLRGFDKINSTVNAILDPDAILTRTNATAVRNVLTALKDGKTVHLVGGGNEIVMFTKAARDLMNGIRVDHPELACFDNWGEVQDYVEQDEQGGDLRLLVNLIDEFTVEVILDALTDQPNERDADLVVSTAHKAKGREWDTVQIAADFPEDRLAKGDEAATDELRLLYVAVTRARRELDVEALTFLRDRVAPDATPAKVEPVTRERHEVKVSEHVGTIGGNLDFEAVCQDAKGMTTKYGYTHLTRFVDDDGNVFKAFVEDELKAGTRYGITATVKAHGEFMGVKETDIRYVRTFDLA